MKKVPSLTALLLLVIITLSAFKCSKESTGNCLKGKIVAGLCADIVIEITEGSYDPSRVVAQWSDPQTGNTYHNVFAVTNNCVIQTGPGMQEGSVISFQFDDSSPANTCFYCLATRPVPNKKNAIKLTDCQ